MNGRYTSEGVYAREKNEDCCKDERRGNSSISALLFLIFGVWENLRVGEGVHEMEWIERCRSSNHNDTDERQMASTVIILSRCTRGMSGPPFILLIHFFETIALVVFVCRYSRWLPRCFLSLMCSTFRFRFSVSSPLAAPVYFSIRKPNKLARSYSIYHTLLSIGPSITSSSRLLWKTSPIFTFVQRHLILPLISLSSALIDTTS